MNTNHKIIEQIINIIQKWKCQQNQNFIFSNFHDEMNYLRGSGNFHSEEDLFSKNTQGLAKTMPEALLLINFFEGYLKSKLSTKIDMIFILL